MASLIKRFTFTPNTVIDADQVNTNLDEIVSFINTQVVHVDGTKPFQAVPSGPNLDPTAQNHLTRKSYVDAKVAGINAPGWLGMAGTSMSFGPFPSGQVIVAGGRNGGFTDGNGDIRVNFSGKFPHGVISVVGTPINNVSYNFLRVNVGVTFVDTAGVLFRVSDSQVGNSIAGQSVQIGWIALGW